MEYINRVPSIQRLIYTQGIRNHQAKIGDNLNKELGASWAQVVPAVKNPPVNAGDIRDKGSNPGLGRSPGGGHATHSSILAWEVPWTDEPGGLQSIDSQRVGHD